MIHSSIYFCLDCVIAVELLAKFTRSKVLPVQRISRLSLYWFFPKGNYMYCTRLKKGLKYLCKVNLKYRWWYSLICIYYGAYLRFQQCYNGLLSKLYHKNTDLGWLSGGCTNRFGKTKTCQLPFQKENHTMSQLPHSKTICAHICSMLNDKTLLLRKVWPAPNNVGKWNINHNYSI